MASIHAEVSGSVDVRAVSWIWPTLGFCSGSTGATGAAAGVAMATANESKLTFAGSTAVSAST
jgi:hypothetical protein